MFKNCINTLFSLRVLAIATQQQYNDKMVKCNYHCPICRSSQSIPNLAGKFHVISTTHCQCNGCNTIFEKDAFYSQPENPNNLDGRWSIPTHENDAKSEIETQPDSIV